MNLLSDALGHNNKSKSILQPSSNYSIQKSANPKENQSIWLLDCDADQQQPSLDDVNTTFVHIVQHLIQKKFHNPKFFDQNEDIHSEIINELCSHLIDIPTQLAKLTRIESAIVEISDSYLGEMKNYLKTFQSLLDIRIRKLSIPFCHKQIGRKQKKTQLSEYEKIVNDNQLFIKKNNQVIYIDEDRDQKKHIHRKENRIKNAKVSHFESKKSYGTMNSKSNENQSGSGQRSAGSQSRSSEGNALTVLLSNRDHKRKDDEKNDRIQKSSVNNESYNFSAMICNSVAVRQRTDKKPINKQDNFHNETIKNIPNKLKKKDSASDEKNQGFIFHRPKKEKRHL